MAVYIEILKIREDPVSVYYRYATTDDRSGVFSIDRETASLNLLEELPGDESGKLYARAAHKIVQHWKKGALPEKTCWAS